MSTAESLQDTLTSEHAAVWLYGTLGGLTSASSQAALYAALERGYALHRKRRDDLIDSLTRLGEKPVAAAPSYRLENAAQTPEQIRTLARLVENRCAQAYADLVANTSGARRTWAVAALRDAAEREVSFGAEPSPWPGAPDLD